MSGRWDYAFNYTGTDIWTNNLPVVDGIWRTGGAINGRFPPPFPPYCPGNPGTAGDCIGNEKSYLVSHDFAEAKEGPELPLKTFSHCSINLNETHTMIAGGIQSSSPDKACSSWPILNGAPDCFSNLTWIYNWIRKEWTKAQDLPRPAAYASCGLTEIKGNKYVLISGQRDIQYSINVTVQLWSYETETWSMEVPQPAFNQLSVPSNSYFC